MKYQVTRNFIDKYTKVYYPDGGIFETDSEKRAKELQGPGFIGEEIKPPEKPKSKGRKGKNDEN